MERRKFLNQVALLTGAGLTTMSGLAARPSNANAPINEQDAKPVLTVAHITDVHIREGDRAPQRFKECLRKIIKEHKVDFFLNGGDSIHDASYDDVKRERVHQLWDIWDDCVKEIKDYDMYSCIGNHDPWWKAPTKQDDMYGKEYVVKRLHVPGRYYSFSRGGWHFIILDGNNDKISLDAQQFAWLEKDLEALPKNTPTLLMSHYPILGTTQVLVGGGHSDCKELKNLFYKHHDKVRICLSGHNHLSDNTLYNDVRYCCNGAMSGFWWGKGDKYSAQPGYYLETPPGFAILKLYQDGRVTNTYIPHGI